MLLCLDIGNTHIFGGVFDGDKLLLRFRHVTTPLGTADQFGLFLRGILRENGIAYESVCDVAMSSVVPGANFTVRHAILQYFGTEAFTLTAESKTGLDIRYTNPAELGADRLANAIGAAAAFPDKNLIIADLGTATTFAVVTAQAEFLGGLILPGLRTQMAALASGTAKLMEVDIEAQSNYLGRTTRENIQRGLFFGHLGSLKEIIAGLKQEQFSNEDVTVVATGGFSQLFREQGVFNAILPDLVLQGLRMAHEFSKGI